MRTDKKYQVIGAFAGAGIGATICLAIQKQKLEKEDKELSWDTVNGWQLLLYTAAGGFLGANAGDLLYKFKAFHEDSSSFNARNFLGSLLTKESIKSDTIHFNLVIEYRQKVKDALNKIFGSKLVDFALDAGSFKNRTAIASDYDVDIILPFKKTAFVSLASMHDCVYLKLERFFGIKAVVVKNRRTIGITFTEGTHKIHFDIAPGREMGDFKNDGKLNMYVSPNWVWQNGSSIKINVEKQNKLTVNNREAREVIRLIKSYALRNGLNIPPVLITQLTVEAVTPPGKVLISKDENLYNSMHYLAKKLMQNAVWDNSNSNNNLLAKMTYNERVTASELLFSDLNKVEANPTYLNEIFK